MIRWPRNTAFVVDENSIGMVVKISYKSVRFNLTEMGTTSFIVTSNKVAGQ